MNQLDPQVKTVWALRSFMRTCLRTVFVFVIESVATGNDWSLLGMPYGGWTALSLIGGIAWLAVFPQILYRRWFFDFRSEEVCLKYGFLTIVEIIAPYIRIQHIDVVQSVWDRMFGLSSLVIHTAGSRSSSLVVPGLQLEYAESVRDFLKTKVMQEDADVGL